MLGRRQFLAGTMAAATTAAGRFAFAAPIQSEFPLWPHHPPGGKGPLPPLVELPRGAVRRIAVPTLQVVRPAAPSRCSVLIIPGGGYKRIERRHEGEPAAQWFAERGATAFILTYRLPAEEWDIGPLAPLQDAQRAIRFIRSLPDSLELGTHRVGVLGFSAGGHLAGMVAARSSFQSYAALDVIDRLSARPDWCALAYPVISLLPPDDRTEARRILVGDDPAPERAAEWSVQTHITSDCPPIFSIGAKDDPIAGTGHLRLLAEACEQAGVPDRMVRFENGGHGFAMGRPGTETQGWPETLAEWLKEQQMLL